MKALKKPKNKDEEPSVLQRVLAMDNDTKMATILALDLFLVGIDTVRFIFDIFLLIFLLQFKYIK